MEEPPELDNPDSRPPLTTLKLQCFPLANDHLTLNKEENYIPNAVDQIRDTSLKIYSIYNEVLRDTEIYIINQLKDFLVAANVNSRSSSDRCYLSVFAESLKRLYDSWEQNPNDTASLSDTDPGYMSVHQNKRTGKDCKDEVFQLRVKQEINKMRQEINTIISIQLKTEIVIFITKRFFDTTRNEALGIFTPKQGSIVLGLDHIIENHWKALLTNHCNDFVNDFVKYKNQTQKSNGYFSLTSTRGMNKQEIQILLQTFRDKFINNIQLNIYSMLTAHLFNSSLFFKFLEKERGFFQTAVDREINTKKTEINSLQQELKKARGDLNEEKEIAKWRENKYLEKLQSIDLVLKDKTQRLKSCKRANRNLNKSIAVQGLYIDKSKEMLSNFLKINKSQVNNIIQEQSAAFNELKNKQNKDHKKIIKSLECELTQLKEFLDKEKFNHDETRIQLYAAQEQMQKLQFDHDLLKLEVSPVNPKVMEMPSPESASDLAITPSLKFLKKYEYPLKIILKKKFMMEGEKISDLDILALLEKVEELAFEF